MMTTTIMNSQSSHIESATYEKMYTHTRTCEHTRTEVAYARTYMQTATLRQRTSSGNIKIDKSDRQPDSDHQLQAEKQTRTSER